MFVEIAESRALVVTARDPTPEWLVFGVSPHMRGQLLLVCKRFPTSGPIAEPVIALFGAELTPILILALHVDNLGVSDPDLWNIL